MNKDWNMLWEADRQIRELKPVGMCDGKKVKLTIELINGFELFNTRPYHNYETWSDGYRVSDGTITVEAEDLDDAIRLFRKKVEDERTRASKKGDKGST
jgi:hypothetical protein